MTSDGEFSVDNLPLHGLHSTLVCVGGMIIAVGSVTFHGLRKWERKALQLAFIAQPEGQHLVHML